LFTIAFQHVVLNLLIWLPILGAIIAMCFNREKHAQYARITALIFSLLSLALCVPLWLMFDVNQSAMQFVNFTPWISAYGIYYHIGVDGISMPMIVLTTITTLMVVLGSWHVIKKNVAQYLATFLIVQGMMVGVFCALDSILFYVFWEAMLIPIYLNIGIWGGERRVYASVKFFIYTFAGSALMLIAFIYLRQQTHSFEILDFYPLPLSSSVQSLIFFAFLIAFAVKIPMWPFHTWLPDAHAEAPSGGSVVLAALMLKMGVYGFLRFNLPVTPDASGHYVWLMIVLSLIAIIYIGMVAIVQKDMKRLIAYSSIAHMGFATLGTFMIYQIIKNTGNHYDAYMALEGAMMQMISHAFSTGALFIGVGILYDKVHSRLISEYSGVAHKMPVFASLMMLFAMSNAGLPGTSGFVGEWMIILSSFKADFWVTFLAATTLILSAAYTLWMFKRVFFGELTSTAVRQLTDVQGAEKIALFILAALVLFIGFYPEPVLNVFHASVGNLLQLATTSKVY
jgi:NADH-quinone oxidoreductase subunit M